MENIKVYKGKVLRAIREARKLTCPEIARKYDISAPAIYDYEQGRSFPRANNAKALAQALNIDIRIFESFIEKSEIATGTATSSFTVAGNGENSQEVSHTIYSRISPDELAEKIIAACALEAKKTAVEKNFGNTKSEVEVVTDLEGAWLPVITEAAAAECNPGIMPLLDCVAEYSEEQAFFPQGKKTDFAIKVSGSSMMPWYPPKTLLLVRPYQDIQQGKRVVAVLDNGEILFKIFARTNDNRIALMSINDEDGQDFFFPANGKGIRYICRVIQSIRNEDDLDEAMRESGIHHRWEEKLKNL